MRHQAISPVASTARRVRTCSVRTDCVYETYTDGHRADGDQLRPRPEVT